MRVTVCWTPAARSVREQEFELPEGALEQPLRDGDRVEAYRALTVDPKVARRERFRKQGSRGAGLFATRRPGAKPGY